MKKISLFAFAALLLASCSDDLGKDFSVDVPEGKTKLVASYPISGDENSRTSLTSSLKYQWDQGDALGVFSTTGSTTTNAYFAYNQSTNAFYGDMLALKGNEYYIYYPYASGYNINSGNIVLNINQAQNYNHKATGYGSFSQGEAPAVGYGVAATDEATGTEYIDTPTPMQAMTSFMAVAVTGLSTINDVELKIAGGTNDGFFDLNGTVSVPVTKLSSEASIVTSDITFTPAENNSTVITLDCGAGVPLQLDTPTYFWFVIPAGLKIAEQNITFSFNKSGSDYECVITAQTSESWNEKNGETGTVLNGVTMITPSGQGSAFEYAPTGTYYIDSQEKFLEYAYLATSWTTAVDNYFKIEDSYGDNIQQTPEQIIDEYTHFADMVNLIDEEGDVVSENIKSLKDAVIIKNITFNQSAIKTWLETGEMPAPTSRGGAIPDPTETPVPAYTLPAYLQGAYGNFAMKDSLPTIGGGTSVTISGLNKTITLSDLSVQGNGLFTATSANSLTINNITFENVTVINPQGYFLNANYNGVTYTGVTVGSGCTVTMTNEEVAGAAETGSNGALFNAAGSNYYTQFETAINTEGVDMLFANILNIRGNVNFTEGVGLNAFGTLSIPSNAPTGCVLEVYESDAVGLITTEGRVDNPTNKGYSVVANGTSYWTGTTYETNNYAEGLAYIMQEATTEKTFNMTMDINLLGSEGMIWWNNTASDKNVNITSTGQTISNVLITGLTDEGKGSPYLSVFGMASNVTGGLVIDGLTINNENEGATFIAALSAYPTGANNYAIVKNMTVNPGKYSEPFGGLYSGFPSSLLPSIDTENSSCEFTPDPEEGIYGTIAGDLGYTITVAEPTINGYNLPNGSFGQVSVNVDGTGAGTSNILFIEFEKANFNIPETNGLTLPEGANIGDSFIGDFKLKVTGINGEFTVNVPVPNSTSLYYQFVYNVSDQSEITGGLKGVANIPTATKKSMMKR